MNFMRGLSRSLVISGSAVFLLVGYSCGKKESSDTPPSPSPTATVTAAPTQVPESSPVSFWLAPGSTPGFPVAQRFDSAGRASLQVDLMKFGIDRGPITALTFLDSSTLLFFVNPGTDKETFGTVDVKTGLVKNKAWGAESSIKAMFKNLPVRSMIAGFQSGVLLALTDSSVKSIRYNQDGGLLGDTFYDSTTLPSECPVADLTGMALVQGGGGSQVIVMSAGGQPRLNVLTLTAGVVSCKSTLDYSNGVTTAAHRAVSLVQMPDGKVYVLYQHDVVTGSDPKIVRYDYDGTSLSNAQEIFKGSANLGKKPFGLIARTNRRLMVARPDVSALIEVALKGNTGEQTDYYEKTSFASDLSALIAEPFQ
ncbi:MAG: hypothetical protein RIR26_1481 [Pseudomonadota bacterium]|jgi:hypothetical protein